MNQISANANSMPDIQSTVDQRQLVIDKVGIRRVKFPVRVPSESQDLTSSVGEWSLTVELPAESKGTHMSRFMKLLEQYRNEILTADTFKKMATDLLPLLDAQRGYLGVSFPFFAEKEAPVSKIRSLMDYEVTMTAQASAEGVVVETQVAVPVMSLCPCSKEISDFGAHNQRSQITLSWISDDDIKLEDMIRLVEKQGSSELWSLLKRPDEKYVTEYSYHNPKFVEDLTRDVAVGVKKLDNISYFRIEVENFESIHNHSAYAMIEG